MMICKKCYVSGHVQGVWFRDTTRKTAMQLNLHGHAINLPDGRVEVVVCGPVNAVNELVDWLWTGSPMSQVTGVDCQEINLIETEKFSIG